MMYDLDIIEAPGNLYDQDINNPYRQWQQNKRMSAISKFVQSSDGNETRRMIAMYLASVTEVDLAIGRILVELEKLDLHHDTLVVYTSDHGDMLGSHGKVDKTPWFYDESLRVPLIMRHPRLIPAGTIVHRPVSTLDIAPTILDFMLRGDFAYMDNTNIFLSDDSVDEILLKMEGRSLRNMLHKLQIGGSDVDIDTSLSDKKYSVSFWENDPPTKWGYAYAVRTEKWKLMWNIQHSTHALYNLAFDPLEKNNLFQLYGNGNHGDGAKCHVPADLISVYVALRGCLINWLHGTGNLKFMHPKEWCAFDYKSNISDKVLATEISEEAIAALANICSPSDGLHENVKNDWGKQTMRLSVNSETLDSTHSEKSSLKTLDVKKKTDLKLESIDITKSFTKRKDTLVKHSKLKEGECADVPSFKDRDGRTCTDYQSNNLCTIFSNDHLQLWNSNFGSFARHAVGNDDKGYFEARQACCACGGSSESKSITKIIRRVLILGQRDSGVEFVKSIVQSLFDNHPVLKAVHAHFYDLQVPPGTFLEILDSGKHLIAGRGQTASLHFPNRISWVAHWNGDQHDLSDIASDPSTLVLVVVAHPWLWHASMCTSPARHGMHMYVTKKGQSLNFKQCLNQEYVVFQENNFKAETDHDPLTNRRFASLSAMRQAKLSGYLAVARSAHRGAVVRLEDFLDANSAVADIQRAMGIQEEDIADFTRSNASLDWVQFARCHLSMEKVRSETRSSKQCSSPKMLPNLKLWPSSIAATILGLLETTAGNKTDFRLIKPIQVKSEQVDSSELMTGAAVKVHLTKDQHNKSTFS